MIRTTTLTALALAALACASLQSANAAVTNLVQTINLKLTIYAEGDSTTNASIVTTPLVKGNATSKDIIPLLGDATGNTFSTGAKLILVSALDGSDDSGVFVRDGTNNVDVSGFFTYDQSSDHVSTGTLNTGTGAVKGTEYRLIELSLHDNGGQVIGAHFESAGLATDKISSIFGSGVVIGNAHQIKATLFGKGDVFGDPFLVQVSLTVAGSAVEVK